MEGFEILVWSDFIGQVERVEQGFAIGKAAAKLPFDGVNVTPSYR